MLNLKGKKVALVCPAPHIEEIEQDLSDYDYIVRTNWALPLTDLMIKNTTARTDIIYLHPDVLNATKIEVFDNVKEFRFYQYQPIDYILKIWKRCKHIDFKHIWEYKDKTGFMPNIGITAISDILSEEPSELYITGMTFYQGKPYREGYNIPEEAKDKYKEEKTPHNQEASLDYFLKNYYSKVKVDEVLKEICEKRLQQLSQQGQVVED